MATTTIIIATTCETRRRESLLRAIDSLATQTQPPPTIVVVVNGDRVDGELHAILMQDARIRVVVEPIGSLPRALHIGRQAVDTAYFGFLDDDDEYLPGALNLRQGVLDAQPEVDVVICNGLCARQGQDLPFLNNFSMFARRPLQALTETNWLASCGALYRSARVDASFFDERFKYLEWTLLGFKLATARRLAFIDAPTFRIHDTPHSLSKSEAYELSHARVLDEVLHLTLPADVRQRVRARQGAAHHTLSDIYRTRGAWSTAWRHHLQSLFLPGGWRYLSYSRRLLLPARQVATG